eukprot:Colp12_sorted_trinity150504_noHs@1304
MSSNDFIKDISKFELRDIIDAMSHQVEHLEKSQIELRAALDEDPADTDFSEAYNENIISLEKKKRTIAEFKAYLKEIDFAYYLEHYRNALLADAAPPAQPPVSEDTGVYL